MDPTPVSSSQHEVELALDARSDLGEGPSWDAATQRLLWVDIPAGAVHRLDPRSGEDERFDVGQPVGAAVPAADGRIALAVSDGFAMLDTATGAIERIADVEADQPDTMMNDGKCDPAGRFWAGTKDAAGSRPVGALYRLGIDRSPTRILTGVAISNGLGWSPDGSTMYYIDSPTHRIDAFAFDAASGDASDRRTFLELPEELGLPDGMTVDEEGFLWVAFWDGAAIRRFDPKGRMHTEVALPVRRVTSCAFGGPDLSELFVTSARDGLSDPELAEQPLAGGVFRIEPGVRGLPTRPYAG